MLLGWLAMQEGGGKTHESQAMHALDVTTISRFVHCIDPSAGMGWGMRGEGGGAGMAPQQPQQRCLQQQQLCIT